MPANASGCLLPDSISKPFETRAKARPSFVIGCLNNTPVTGCILSIFLPQTSICSCHLNFSCGRHPKARRPIAIEFQLQFADNGLLLFAHTSRCKNSDYVDQAEESGA